MSDLINRQDAIDCFWDENRMMRDWLGIIKDIRSLPSAERKHGEWTEEGYCSYCKCDLPAFIEDWEWKRCRTPYCPNCGASMERGEEDVD